MDTQTKRIIPIKTTKKSEGTALSNLHPIAEMERLFNQMLDRLAIWRKPMPARWPDIPFMGDWFEENDFRLPSLDLVDRDNEILVRAEVPGIEKKDIDISMTDNLLTIKGQSSAETKEEKGNYHRHEISNSSFSRSVLLPGAVDASKANANLKDGVLEIILPKLESSKKRNISVK